MRKALLALICIVSLIGSLPLRAIYDPAWTWTDPDRGLTYALDPGTLQAKLISVEPVSEGTTPHITIFSPISVTKSGTTNEYWIHIASDGGTTSLFKDSGYTSIALSGRFFKIDEAAFKDCKDLTYFNLAAEFSSSSNKDVGDSDRVFHIPPRCFQNCSNLKQAHLQKLIKKIGREAFKDCPALTSQFTYWWWEDVKEIGTSAFENCEKFDATLEGLDNLESIGDNAFKNSGITSVTLPGRSFTLGTGVFNNCSKLTTVNFDSQNGPTVIPSKTFNTCSVLTELVFPDYVTTIAGDAFYGNWKLKKLQFPANPNYTTIAYPCLEGSTFENPDGSTVTFKQALNDLIIPSNVTTIEHDAFKSCSIENLNLHPGIRTIGERAFTMNNITQLDVPGGITEIAEGTFSENPLAKITLHDGLQRIGKNAFASESSTFTDFTVPATVKNIDAGVVSSPNLTKLYLMGDKDNDGTGKVFSESAFTSAASLTEVWNYNKVPPTIADATFTDATYTNATLHAINPSQYKAAAGWKKFGKVKAIDITIDGVTYELDHDVAKMVAVDNNAENQKVPAQLTINSPLQAYTYSFPAQLAANGTASFFKNSALANLTLKGTFASTAIPDYTFYQCAKLNTLNMSGAHITSVGKYAFANCALTSATFPSSVQSMGEQAFGYNKITSLTMPKELTELERGAFRNNQIAGINWNGCNLTKLRQDVLCNNLLTRLELPSQMKVLDRYSVFNNPLQQITFNAALDSIGEAAFKYHTQDGEQYRPSYTELHITPNVKEIGNSAFYGCDKLTAIYLDCSDSAPKVATTAFDPTTGSATSAYNDATLYIKGAAAKYILNQEGWLKFKNIHMVHWGVTYAMAIDAETGGHWATLISATNAWTGEAVPAKLTITSPMNDIKLQWSVVLTADGVTSHFKSTALQELTLRGGRIVNSVVPAYAFHECANLQKVTMDSSVEIIGNRAFDHCNISSLSLSTTLSEIGDSAFAYNKIAELRLPKTLSKLGTDAFRDNEISSIDWNDNHFLTEIPHCAFGNNLLSSIDIPAQITTLGTYSLYNNPLTEIKLHDGLETIDGHAFQYFSNDDTRYQPSYTEVSIPATVMTIGESAFEGCDAFKTLKLYDAPRAARATSEKNFGQKAFGTHEMADVYTINAVPPTIHDQAFSEATYQNAQLHVLQGTENDYRNAEGWKKFYNLNDATLTGIEDVAAGETEADGDVDIYTLSGVHVYSGPEQSAPHLGGLYIVRRGDKVRKAYY